MYKFILSLSIIRELIYNRMYKRIGHVLNWIAMVYMIAGRYSNFHMKLF